MFLIKHGGEEKNMCKYTILLFITIIAILFSFKEKNNYKNILVYPELQIEEYKNYFDLLNYKNTFDWFKKKNKIENIFILISVLPFLKNEIIITKKNEIQ